METVKVHWDTSKLRFEAGENFKATIDAEKVAGALAAVAAGGASLGKLPSLFTGMSAATAFTYVVLRYVRKTWPWTDASLGEDKNLQVAFLRYRLFTF